MGYRKRQERKQNLSATIQKTATFSKFAFKKGSQYAMGATSALMSATNKALTKMEDARESYKNGQEHKPNAPVDSNGKSKTTSSWKSLFPIATRKTDNAGPGNSFNPYE